MFNECFKLVNYFGAVFLDLSLWYKVQAAPIALLYNLCTFVNSSNSVFWTWLLTKAQHCFRCSQLCEGDRAASLGKLNMEDASDRGEWSQAAKLCRAAPEGALAAWISVLVCSCCCDKHHDQRQLGEEMVYIISLTLSDHSLSLRAVRAGTQGRHLEQKSWKHMVYCSGSCSSEQTFLILPSTASPGMAPSTMSGAHLHQSTITALPTYMATG